MAMEFKKARRHKAKIRMAVSGPSGSGKTYGALLIAKGIGGRIAVIDTERGSASLYDHLCDYDTLELEPPYSPERFIEAITAAENAGYDIVIIDSGTHEWDGAGGCLEINETLAKTRYKGNTWSAWSETHPRHQAFVDKINQSKCHVIFTMRSKTETAQKDGKVLKLGTKDVQREGMEYEFTIVFNLSHDTHYVTVSKDRTEVFKGDPFIITPAVGKKILDWMNSGAESTFEQPPPPKFQPPEPPSTHPIVDDTSKLFAKHVLNMSSSKSIPELVAAFTAFNADRAKFTAEQIVKGASVKDEMKAKLIHPQPPVETTPSDATQESDSPY